MVFLQNPVSIIYFYYAIKDWNLLPNTLNNIKNLDEFKNLGFKQFLSEKGRNDFNNEYISY